MLPPIHPSNSSTRLVLYSGKWNRYISIPVVKFLLHQLIHTSNMEVGNYYHPCLYQGGKKGQYSESTGHLPLVSIPKLSVEREAPPKGNISRACWDEPAEMSQI